jgi:cytochrome c-type biogenesis protein CcsB
MNYAYYSSLLLVSAVVVYSCAVIAHAAEWAAARQLGVEPVDLRQAVRVGAATASTHQPPQSDRDHRTTVRTEACGRAGTALMIIGFGLNLGGVVFRGVAAQRAPWGNMLEFLTTSMVLVVAGYLLLAWRRGSRWLGLPIAALAALANGLAVTVFYVAVAPLVPALHSVWFLIHIIAAALSGAAFNIGALTAALYLIKSRAEHRGRVSGYLHHLPDSRTLDRISYRFNAFAFPIWTFAVAAGAIWAEYAWGRYWGWDPKETWALITWVVYACYLHARSTAGWKGRKAALIALLGVATFWFNFIGINLLVSGLHSYAGV